MLAFTVFTKFHPSVGGIETLADVLSREWVAAGHRVTIVTDVPAAEGDTKQFPFRILRNPRSGELLKAVRDCDLALQHNISLKMIWPIVAARKPFVAVHHSTYHPFRVPQPWREKVKQQIAKRRAHNICVSHAVKHKVGCDGAVIPNPYDHAQFHNRRGRRTKELVFVGRLVSDKGVVVLLDALRELKRAGLMPSLTVVGDGPERANIERQIQQLELLPQVKLVGWKNQEQTAAILNEHQILVVPSLWDEPFGIVALEGAACGCVVVGSSGGGLPEAIGPCGVTFPNGDYLQLAEVLGKLLRNPDRLEPYRQAAAEHLQKHRPEVIAAKYIEFFRSVLAGREVGQHAG